MLRKYGRLAASNASELVVAGVVLIGAVALYGAKFSASPSSELERNLFDGLEFFFSVALGWAVQAIVAKSDFQKSMRRYALSAYRRVVDIRRSLDRLDAEMQRVGLMGGPGIAASDLYSLQTLVRMVADTVDSSGADWSEIIENEVRATQEIKRLSNEADRIVSASVQPELTATKRVAELQDQINKIRMSLPAILQDAVMASKEDTLPRAGRLSPQILQSLEGQAQSGRGLKIQVRLLGLSGSSWSQARVDTSGPWYFRYDVAAGTEYLVLVDNADNDVGTVGNPFPDEYHKDYLVTLFHVLRMHGYINTAQQIDRESIPPEAVFRLSGSGDQIEITIPLAT